MFKTDNLKSAFLILLVGCLALVIINSISEKEKVTLLPYQAINISSPEAKSAIGIKENINARETYEKRMLIDPKTGEVPINIRAKELKYTKTLPTRGYAKSNLRRKNLREISGTEWKANGPFNVGGRTRALAIDITNESIILAGGTSGGMWRSEDNGNHWNKTTKSEALHSVSSISQDKRIGKENIWYYGTGELIGNSARAGGGATYRGDGIFKSIDDGANWISLLSTSGGNPNEFTNTFQFVWNVATNPNNLVQDEIFAATFGGLQRSVDGGLNWQYVIGAGNNDSPLYSDIAISNNVMYATMSQSSPKGTAAARGVYRSTNGTNWIKITPPGWPIKYDKTIIGIAPSNPNVVYFLSSSEPNDLWKYTYISGDGNGAGGQWVNLTPNIPMFGGETGDFDSQGSYNMVLKVHPTNEDLVFLGGTNLYRSTNGFSTTNGTAWIGGYSPANDITNYTNQHPDQHNLVFYPSNPNKALSSHDGGISITNNINGGEVAWQSLNNGYVTTQFYALDIGEINGEDVIVGGLQDNGSYLSSPSNNWNQLLGGDGGYSAIGHNGSNIYASSQGGRIIRYFQRGDELIPVARIDPALAGKTEGQEFLFINPFIIDPHNNSKMYVAGGDKIWRNPNVTQIPGSSDSTTINWFDIPQTKITSGQISTLAISRTPKNILYYGTTEGKVYKVENADLINTSATNITNALFPSDGYVSCIDIDPTDANNILVVFSNYNIKSIFQSTDGGNTFQAVSGNLDMPEGDETAGPSVRWAKIIPLKNNEYIYLAATSAGLYSTTSLEGDNTVWAMEGADIIGNVVIPMISYEANSGTVAIATHGNGVYTKAFDNVLPLESENTASLFSLEQNFPNPFTDITTIKFTLPKQAVARIQIYNQEGKKVRKILLATQFEGENEVIWDGKDGNGTYLSNGIYYYRLEYGIDVFEEESFTKKMILAR